MSPNPGIIAIEPLEFRHIPIDNARVLTMSHDRKRIGIGKNMIECLIAVNKHIARAAAHEKLDAGNAVRIEFTE